jgi:hypothetical protein
VAHYREKGAFRAVCILGSGGGTFGALLRLKECILELPALDNFHENAVRYDSPIPLVAHRIAERTDFLPVPGLEEHEHFLRAPMKLYKREEVCLMKDPTADSENIFYMLSKEIFERVSQSFEERAVCVHDFAVIAERDESARSSFKQIVR